jgi:hypothetical protein
MTKAILVTVGVILLCYITMYALLMFQVVEMFGALHGK